MTTILVNQMNSILYIQQDQSGFLQNRFLKDNIRKLPNLIDHVQCETLSVLFYLVDAEKVLTRSFGGLWSIFNAMSFGQEVLKWMNIIYKHQSATVISDGYISKKIQISRGVWQCCPPSPVLFNLVVEMLAIAFGQTMRFKVLISSVEYKLELYANDLEFFNAKSS